MQAEASACKIFVNSSSVTAVDRETTWAQRLLRSPVTHSDRLKDKILPVTRHGGSRGITHLIQPAKRTPPNISRNKSSNTQRTENKTTDVVIHQHSRRLLKMDILIFETC